MLRAWIASVHGHCRKSAHLSSHLPWYRWKIVIACAVHLVPRQIHISDSGSLHFEDAAGGFDWFPPQ